MQPYFLLIYSVDPFCFVNFSASSVRYMVVCHVAQEARIPHRKYIDRKNNDVIFLHT